MNNATTVPRFRSNVVPDLACLSMDPGAPFSRTSRLRLVEWRSPRPQAWDANSLPESAGQVKLPRGEILWYIAMA